MGCNAWNHGIGCNCGWGGDTGGGGRVVSYSPFRQRNDELREHSFARPTVTYESYVNPNAKCPVCGADVFFYQSSDGGRVFFDSLGRPWPKHPCTDTSPQGGRTATATAFAEAVDRRAFEKEGWEPIFEARWTPWVRSTYRPGVLLGFLGRARRPISLTFPFGMQLNLHAPLLGRAHASNKHWLWVDAPYLSSPVLGCVANPPSFLSSDLAELAVQTKDGNTFVKLAHMCSFEIEDVPGRANYRQARLWLEAAAELGDWRAQNNLGVIYECGLGVPPDPEKTLAIYHLAAAQGGKIAVRNFERLTAGQRLRSDPVGRGRHLADAWERRRPLEVEG